MNINEYTEYINKKLSLIQGKSLFRYRSGEYNNDGICYSIEALKNKNMWFSAANTMDDIFDCKVILPASNMDKLVCIVREKLSNKPQIDYKIVEDILDEHVVDERTQKITYLACFSENNNSPLMWNYYASKHKGFCIEYDYESLYKCVNDYESIGVIFLTPVVYDNISNTKGLNIGHAVTLKKLEWSFENEWRIINVSEDNVGKFIPVTFDIKPKAIYLGYYVSDTSRLYSELKLYCKENDVKLKKPRLVKDTFSFEYDEVDLE